MPSIGGERLDSAITQRRQQRRQRRRIRHQLPVEKQSYISGTFTYIGTLRSTDISLLLLLL